MSQLHFFFCSALLLLLAWSGYRSQYQQTMLQADVTEPMFDLLDVQHKRSMLVTQWLLQTYQRSQWGFTRQKQVLFFDTRFQQLDSMLENGAPAANAFEQWQDSVRALGDKYYVRPPKWVYRPTIPPTVLRLQTYLLQHYADNYLESSVHGNHDYEDYGNQVRFSTYHDSLLLGDTLKVDIFPWNRLFEAANTFFINGQALGNNGPFDGSLDTTFLTPGWHTLDVRLATEHPYFSRTESRQFKIFVLND